MTQSLTLNRKILTEPWNVPWASWLSDFLPFFDLHQYFLHYLSSIMSNWCFFWHYLRLDSHKLRFCTGHSIFSDDCKKSPHCAPNLTVFRRISIWKIACRWSAHTYPVQTWPSGGEAPSYDFCRALWVLSAALLYYFLDLCFWAQW